MSQEVYRYSRDLVYLIESSITIMAYGRTQSEIKREVCYLVLQILSGFPSLKGPITWLNGALRTAKRRSSNGRKWTNSYIAYICMTNSPGRRSEEWKT